MRYLLLFCLLSACRGYHFRNQTNPFENYAVRTVAIPMFLNQSPVPNTSAPFTKEISLLLSQYPGLKVVNADTGHADAVLVGIIDAKEKFSETVKPNGYKITNSVAPKSLNGRSDFFIPFTTSIALELRLILIKDPSSEDIKLLTSDLGQQIRGNPKIIFNELLGVGGGFNREIFDEAGGKVNFTQSKGAFDRTIKSMAQNAASNFKDMVLNAF